MDKWVSCEIIRDLLPGYVDGILSEAGTDLVKTHLEGCADCRQVYQDMKEEIGIETESGRGPGTDSGIRSETESRIGSGRDSEKAPGRALGRDLQEQAVLDGLKKVRQHTRNLKIAIGIVSSLLAFLLLGVFWKVYVVGEPLSAHGADIQEISYQEEDGSLVIQGTTGQPAYRVSRVGWEEDEEQDQVIYVWIYVAERLPFQEAQQAFSISIPDVQGKTVYLVGRGYDRREVYSWWKAHDAQIRQMRDAVYEHCPELDRSRDVLSVAEGIRSVQGRAGICFSVDSVTGENASVWEVNGQFVTDGQLESQGREIWISLDQPYQMISLDQKKLGALLGSWEILDDPIFPAIGYDSRSAGAEELLGKELTVSGEPGGGNVVLEWDGERYQLEHTETMDWNAFSKTYIIHSGADLERFAFPVEAYVFTNADEELSAVTLLADQNGRVFVRFNDLIGDLAVFSLERR